MRFSRKSFSIFLQKYKSNTILGDFTFDEKIKRERKNGKVIVSSSSFFVPTLFSTTLLVTIFSDLDVAGRYDPFSPSPSSSCSKVYLYVCTFVKWEFRGLIVLLLLLVIFGIERRTREVSFFLFSFFYILSTVVVKLQ